MQPGWVPDSIFYLIFPDRFARSSRLEKPSNLESWDTAPSAYGFKGGDLYGILEKLDYLQDLGITAILLNPVFTSAANHRYHTMDYYSVDPMLGGNAALRALTDELHSRGMRIVLDGVFNHTGRGFYQFNHTLENGSSSPFIDWFHFNMKWLNSGRPIDAYPQNYTVLEAGDGSRCLERYGYKGWWDLPALPKLNTDNEAVRRFLFDVARFWIDFGVDGWRLDVPSEIDDDAFWQEFRQTVKRANPESYIVGEIWDDAARWLKGDQFDGVMNYPLTRAITAFFPQKHLDMKAVSQCGGYRKIQPLDDREFRRVISDLVTAYPFEVQLTQLNLIGSHDTPRFLTCAGEDPESLILAAAFLCTFPGAPCFYYGDETGMKGGADPECRKTFPWEEFRWDRNIHNAFKLWIKLRSDHIALRRGSFSILQSAEDTFAFAREHSDESLVSAFNSSSERKALHLWVGKGNSLRDLFSDRVFPISDGAVHGVSLEPRSACVFEVI